MRSMARVRNCFPGAGALALAASLVLGVAPAMAQNHGFHGHAAAAHEGPAMHGPMRLADGPHRFGGPHPEGHWEGGHGGWQGGHEGHWEGGHWGGGHYWGGGPRYAVPPHWAGMHPDWDGPRPGYWVRPWGPRWEPRYWGGGYWGGRFWPHVYLDWDFPWFVATLPIGYSTYWWSGVPYYYWQGVYYVWSPDYGEYVVTDPPPVTGGLAQGAAPPPTSAAQAQAGDGRGAMSLYVYPKKGQSEQQTENDRYQCHEWSVGQTGYDPSNTANNTQASTATPENYKRAVTACLEARGYSVR